MEKRLKALLTRVILFFAALILSLGFQRLSGQFWANLFHYTPTPFLYGTLEALVLGLMLFMGILFGAVGRKFEYGWIIMFALAAFILYFFVSSEIPKYGALIAAIAIGNAIGFAIKKIRQQFLIGGAKLGKL